MENVWEKIRTILAANLQEAQYKVWIAPLGASWDGETLRLEAVNDFAANFLRGRFSAAILEAASQVLGFSPKMLIFGRNASLASDSLGLSLPADKPDPVIGGGIPSGPSGIVSAGSASGAGFQPGFLLDSRAGSRLGQVFPVEAGKDAKTGSGQVQGALPLHWGEASRMFRPWRHSFDDFVVGPCNELAHAAAKGICRTDFACDLLFLTSAPGLGKTHLMQSVGAGLVKASNFRALKVEYLSAEEFATQMRIALKAGEIDRFKTRYREADVLLLEDIHFLQDKEKTQDEVLATISCLLQRGSRVVLSSSFSLRELRRLNGQLLSRLGSGLMASIGKPDLDTRRRIITSKAASHRLSLSDEVAGYLAESINSDVRRIEGCLRSLALKASLLNQRISLEMARQIVADYLGRQQPLSLPLIISLVCQGFGIEPEAIHSKSRKQNHVHARNAIYFLARKHTDLSLQEIGRNLNRTHSTVIKGITSLEKEISRQSSLGRQLASTISLVERNSARDNQAN